MFKISKATNIFNNATKRTMILTDKVGRGTSFLDGLPIT
ncbi:MutS-related protein [Candidatus Pseudomonas adelgestsugas]